MTPESIIERLEHPEKTIFFFGEEDGLDLLINHCKLGAELIRELQK